VQQQGSERDKASRGSDNADQQDYDQITIEQPVHHDGSEALEKWVLVERLIGLALGAREVNAGEQSLRAPALSGALLSTSFAGLPLVVCGVLKIAYDLSLLFSFRHI
jgi:hypothetical protein